MAAELKLFEALVEAGVSKEKARAVVLAQEEAMSQSLSDLATRSELLAAKGELKSEMGLLRSELKAEIAALRSELGGQIAEFRANVDGRFALAAEQMRSIGNQTVIRLGSLMVVLFGLMGGFLAWSNH